MPPYRGNRAQFEANRRLVLQGQQAVLGAASFGIITQVTRSVRESPWMAPPELYTFIEGVAANRIPKAQLKQAHHDIGIAAQRSTVQAFTHRRNNRRTPPDRIQARDPRNRRFAGGALRRAIQAPDFFEATFEGLLWANVTRLNAEAKQWMRVNYGAGGRAGQRPERFQVRWGNLVVAQLGLRASPRAAFRIPRGFWVGGDGGRAAPGAGARFFPVGEQPRGIRGRPTTARMTAGIAASNFLDAGVRRIAREFPIAYTGLVERHMAGVEQRTDTRYRQVVRGQPFRVRRLR